MYLFFSNKMARIHSITESLSKKNILYVKIFQAIAMNKQWIDEDVNHHMMRFTDNVGYSEEDIDTELLEKCKREYHLVSDEMIREKVYIFDFFGNIISEKEEIKEKPIRSGMISLIYKMKRVGQCGEGGYIILKMKRRGIEAKLNESIENLLLLLDILNWFSWFKIYDIFTSIQKNIESLRKQLNFEEEVENLLESTQVCASLPFVEIPYVYTEVTKKYKDVIMMNFLEGNTIEKVAVNDYPIYAKLLMNYNMSALLLNGMSHGDLHPGNILFIKDEKDIKNVHKIGLIDFGIVIRISDEMRQNIFSTLIQMYLLPIEKVARDLIFYTLEPRETLEKIPEEHLKNIVDICCRHFRSVIENKDDFNLIKLYDFIYELNNYNRKEEMRCYVLKINEDIVKMKMSLAMINGIISSLTKNECMKCIHEQVTTLL